MAEKSIKVCADTHEKVVAHTQKVGGKIGKFYDLAASEKLERETLGEKARYDKKLNRIK